MTGRPTACLALLGLALAAPRPCHPADFPAWFRPLPAKPALRITAADVASGMRGRAEITPWSGPWYPFLNNRLVAGRVADHARYLDRRDPDYRASPLAKYALFVRRHAPEEADFTAGECERWELDHHSYLTLRRNERPYLPFLEWQGHCEGLAAASILHPEPVRPVRRAGITFTPADLKALLIESGIGAQAMFYGRRAKPRWFYGDDDRRRRRDLADLGPALFHELLAHFIRDLRRPLIVDVNSDLKVFNYATYAFTSTIVPRRGRPNRYLVTTRITFADYVAEGHGGTKPGQKTYRCELATDNRGLVTGGRWLYRNTFDHPDYVWIPLRDGTRQAPATTRGPTAATAATAQPHSPGFSAPNPFLDPRLLHLLTAGAL